MPDTLSELLEQASADGILDPAELTDLLGGAAAFDPYNVFTESITVEAPVFAGTRQRGLTPVFAPIPEGQQGPPSFRGFLSEIPPGQQGPPTLLPPGTPREQEITKTAGDLLREFYNFDKRRLVEVQRLLFAGGFYGNAPMDAIGWGEADDLSFAAWASVVQRAARFFAAGQKVSVDEILRTAAATGMGLEAEQERQARQVVSLSDPKGLTALLDDTARSVLGRKADLEEQRMFVALIHRLQTDSQLAAQEEGIVAPADVSGFLATGQLPAPAPGVTQFVQPDTSAQAESFLRAQEPEEAAVHDTLARMAAFFDLLGAE